MPSSKSSGDPDSRSVHDSADESEDESEILEESPCGRWQKRREEVQQRDVPGIDNAYLAMDTEEGVEVVWNEVQFSEKKNLKAEQETLKQVFDSLIQLEHPNIVKFHRYWTDTKTDKPRIIFITEYMSSGSLKQFLKKTKKNNRTLKGWKRWCTQILSALSYLHSCQTPVIHGNLSCDTIFIQHNGLIKIGSVAPDAIHNHVKTCRSEARNMHYIAPEYGSNHTVTTAVDIYSFGMCALEMAALEVPSNNGEAVNKDPVLPEDVVRRKLDSIQDRLQKDFIAQCLKLDPSQRPRARELLFHAILFEVHSLRLLSAHTFVQHSNNLPENMTDEARASCEDPNRVIAEIVRKKGESFPWTFAKLPSLELEKLLEDVRNGIFPLTAFALPVPPVSRPRAMSPEVAESVKSDTSEPTDIETRSAIEMSANVQHDDGGSFQLVLLLRMDDRMNRQLVCEFAEEESSDLLAEELVSYGFISEENRRSIAKLIEEKRKHRNGTRDISLDIHISQPAIPIAT